MPFVGVTERSSGFCASRGGVGSLLTIVSTAVLGEAMPIGEGPNSDTWIVFGTDCTPWSTIGTVKLSLATPTGKSSIPLTEVKSVSLTAVHSASPQGVPQPSVM